MALAGRPGLPTTRHPSQQPRRRKTPAQRCVAMAKRRDDRNPTSNPAVFWAVFLALLFFAAFIIMAEIAIPFLSALAPPQAWPHFASVATNLDRAFAATIGLVAGLLG